MGMIQSKGTIAKLSIASVLTAVAQATAIQPPGWKSESYDSSYFDQSGAGKAKDMTGWAEGADFSASFWWDHNLASHAAMLAAITTPVKTTWEILFVARPTDGGGTYTAKKIDFTVADLELTPKVDMAKGLACDIKGGVDGLPVIS